jgi:hypothetical protein
MSSADDARARTLEQLQAIEILKRLDPEGSALGKIRDFVRGLPVGRCAALSSALASWCDKRDKPALALIGAVRGGYAREVAEGIAETRAKRSVAGALTWQDIHDTYGHPKQQSDFEYKQRSSKQQRWLEARAWKGTQWGQEYSFVPDWTPAQADACYSDKTHEQEERHGRELVHPQRGDEEVLEEAGREGAGERRGERTEAP